MLKIRVFNCEIVDYSRQIFWRKELFCHTKYFGIKTFQGKKIVILRRNFIQKNIVRNQT